MSRMAGWYQNSKALQFRAIAEFAMDPSSTPYRSNRTANGLENFHFVGVDDLDFSFVANERRNAHVRQRRAELYIVWAKLSNAAPFLERVTGVEQRSDWRFGIETRRRTEFFEQERPISEPSCFRPRHITVHSVE